jgi:hypothetical protein
VKVNIRDLQVGLWQELADLIGAKHPADAVSYVGVRYLPALIAQLKAETPLFPVATVAVSNATSNHSSGFAETPTPPQRSGAEPSEPLLNPNNPKTEFDDLFDSMS